MSTFHGPQGKGAMRAHRETKRATATDRQFEFEREVARVMREQNVLPETVRRVAASSRRLSRHVARRRATRAQGAPIIRTEGAR